MELEATSFMPIPTLNNIQKGKHSRKKQKQGGEKSDSGIQSNATAAATLSSPSSSLLLPAAHQTSISIQLFMQCLPLKDVESAGQVCRVWSVASSSPLIWSGRSNELIPLFDDKCKLQLNSDSAAVKPVRVTFPQLQQSRLYRNVSSVNVLGPLTSNLLDQLMLLPNLTQINILLDSRLSTLISHPIWSRMRSISLRIEEHNSIEGVSALWQKIGIEFGRSVELRHLTLEITRDELGEAIGWNLNDLLQPIQQLESLSISIFNSDEHFHQLDRLVVLKDLSLAHMMKLHTLKVDLTLLQVEQLCRVETMPSGLQTFDVALMKNNSEEEKLATKVAAETFQLDPSSFELQHYRLACLSRLSELRHLTVRSSGCSAEGMCVLRFAQQQDSNAFRQLQSYSVIDEDGECFTNAEHVDSDIEDADEVPPAAANIVHVTVPASSSSSSSLSPSSSSLSPPPPVLLFPSLTSLHLTCCFADFLSGVDLPELTQICKEAPNLQSLHIKLHLAHVDLNDPIASMQKDSLKWCHSSTLHSLQQLHSLTIDRPYWNADQVNEGRLQDLYALLSLPELSFFELTRVCRFYSRSEIIGLMQLEDVKNSDIEDSDLEVDSSDDEE